jgi:GNAT superfamily N-acetyltransferase
MHPERRANRDSFIEAPEMNIAYRVNPSVTNAELDQLYAVSWPNHHAPYDFRPELERSLVYIGAYHGDELIGFVRLAWDGSVHTFLLEPTVRPDFRRRGIGRTLVERAVSVARERGMEWVHVDYEPPLHEFYRACGFAPTIAGLIHLR